MTVLKFDHVIFQHLKENIYIGLIIKSTEFVDLPRKARVRIALVVESTIRSTALITSNGCSTLKLNTSITLPNGNVSFGYQKHCYFRRNDGIM